MKNNNIITISLALINMALFGSLFPFIKIGYSAFNVNTSKVSDILMFAAMRFAVCGGLLCVLSFIRKEKIEKPKAKSFISITFMGLFAIVLHYAFTYIGLSLTDSSKTALLKQLGVLLYVCFAFLFIKDEKFSLYKITGALIGFCGIVAINYGADGSIKFTVGDYLIIAASFCSVIASILTKKVAQKNSSFWVVGISQLTGGILLFIIGILLGGKMPSFSLKALFVFLYICSASIVGYCLWTYLQKNGDLSKLFIIKFAEPLFACVFGAILLGEEIFKLQYLFAFLLISAGIIIGNDGLKLFRNYSKDKM